jgi:hypothetical protein
MEAYPVSVLVSVAAVHLRPWALMSRVCQVSSFCADTDGPTPRGLRKRAEFWEPFWEPNGPTSPARQRTNPCTRKLRSGGFTPLTLGEQAHGQVD